MDTDNVLITAFATVILTIILTITWSVQKADSNMIEMIKAGATAQEAACAMKQSERNCWIVNRPTQ